MTSQSSWRVVSLYTASTWVSVLGSNQSPPLFPHLSVSNFIYSHCFSSVSGKITPTSEYPALTFPISSMLISAKVSLTFILIDPRFFKFNMPKLSSAFSLNNSLIPQSFPLRKCLLLVTEAGNLLFFLEFPSPNSTPVNSTSQIYLESSPSPAHLSPEWRQHSLSWCSCLLSPLLTVFLHKATRAILSKSRCNHI